MGLGLTAVNKNYGYTKDGEHKKRNERYSDVDIGYIGYKIFRDAFVSFLTGGKIPGMDAVSGKNGIIKECFRDTETHHLPMLKTDFSKEELEKYGKQIAEYLNKLDYIKKQYPKLYDCFAFVEHCDCDGSMPLNQVKTMLPHLKAFYEFDKRNYGYSGRPYNFTADFIKVCEDVIVNKGKLWFS